MFHLIGFIAIVAMSQFAFRFLGIESKFYYDEIALMLVIGGTITVAAITYPFHEFKLLFTSIFGVARGGEFSYRESAISLVDVSRKAQSSKAAFIEASKNSKNDKFLREGFDLITSGLSHEEIQDILTEKIYREKQRDDRTSNVLRNLSKYPPAFGLIGTVLGLVSLMRSIGDGADTSGVGLKMALALIATLYGLTFANFFLVPLAEHFALKAEKAKNLKELQLEGLLMLSEGRSPLAVQEMMNSYLEDNDKFDLIGLKEKAA